MLINLCVNVCFVQTLTKKAEKFYFEASIEFLINTEIFQSMKINTLCKKIL